MDFLLRHIKFKLREMTECTYMYKYFLKCRSLLELFGYQSLSTYSASPLHPKKRE